MLIRVRLGTQKGKYLEHPKFPTTFYLPNLERILVSIRSLATFK